MPEFKRSKSLKIELYRTRWSEEDVARLGRLIRQHTGNVEIKIVTGDGEDRITTAEPEFVRSPDMPTAIRSVEMEAPGCEVKIQLPETDDAWGTTEGATASVRGSDDRVVASLFRDIEKEFKARTIPGGRAVRFLHGFGGLMVTMIFTSTVLISIYYICIRFAADRVLWLQRSPSGTMLLIVGLGLILALAVIQTGRLIKLLVRAFPMVEFDGRLEPSNRFQRKGLWWLLAFILLPFIINVLSGVLLKYM